MNRTLPQLRDTVVKTKYFEYYTEKCEKDNLMLQAEKGARKYDKQTN